MCMCALVFVLVVLCHNMAYVKFFCGINYCKLLIQDKYYSQYSVIIDVVFYAGV